MVMAASPKQRVAVDEPKKLREHSAPERSNRRPRLGGRPARIVVGLLRILGGLGLFAFGAASSSLAMGPRVLLVLLGIGAAHRGIDRTARSIAGEMTDVAYGMAVCWLIVMVGCAILAPVLPLGEASDTAQALRNPINLRPDLLREFPLGTNQLGLDILSRSLHGARVSLVVAVAAAMIGGVIGGCFGIIAGYLKSWVDTTIGIGTNVLLAFPPLVMLLALAAVLPRNVRNQAFALSILVIPANIRLARAMALSFSQREFVQAARAIGASRVRVMTRELIPNVAVPLMSYGFIVVAMMIVAEASLSFLGLGIPQPNPTWGNMIAEGQNGVFEERPYIVLVPATFLFLTVLSFNLVGERLRRRFSPDRR